MYFAEIGLEVEEGNLYRLNGSITNGACRRLCNTKEGMRANIAREGMSAIDEDAIDAAFAANFAGSLFIALIFDSGTFSFTCVQCISNCA